MENFHRYREVAGKALMEHRHSVRAVRDEKLALLVAKRQAKIARDAQEILQTVAASVQTFAHDQIATVVTKCLKTVFGEDAYRFGIEFHRKRGKTEARIRFYRGNCPVCPTGAAGGGTVEVAAFALRLACLLLATPRRRKLLLLDEPFKNLHGAAYQERAAELVMSLARDLNVQFVLVTGLDWLKIGKVVELQ